MHPGSQINAIGSLALRQGSRLLIDTPALVIDIDILDRNIATMARFAADAGIALRPHAKSHKSADIGRRQMAEGAVGLCCAKLGEAEVLALEGIQSLLITSPVVTHTAITRLIALNAMVSGLAVVADNPSNVANLAQAAAVAGRPLRVLVDVDPGVNRTGVTSPDSAIFLAREIVGRPSLSYGGIQFYCGTLQHIPAHADRRTAVAGRTEYLRRVVGALRDAGVPPATVTGAGTGTHHLDAAFGLMNEIQPGSYVFMDSQYGRCDLHGTGRPVFGHALQIDTRVISANHPGRVTIDAGLKAMATDAGPPGILAGAAADATVTFMGDEHSMVMIPNGGMLPGLADLITLVPPHCDPTANLYDRYHVVRGGKLIDIWPVTARGRSQ